ncbi:hypothetical protein T4B_8739 [Trichinella pseudospiralis]|uniref:Uncharacterized protein n=1 Tax=Trichinella pseudospiralis TaxID=6337 RepID=A0A0V1GKX3_TRIPS|nr:hypothetical protein T4B_8739 [Trichinella pseudospiralis]
MLIHYEYASFFKISREYFTQFQRKLPSSWRNKWPLSWRYIYVYTMGSFPSRILFQPIS